MSLPPSPPDLPAGSEQDFQRLLAFPLESPARMLIAVERHLHNVREAAAEYPLVNLEMAQQIADELRQLLRYPADTSELHQRWIQTAARYYFLNEDGGHDWATAEGFEDDLAVVRCIAHLTSLPPSS